MELSGFNIKKFLMFSQKKSFLTYQKTELSYISGNGNHKNFFHFKLEKSNKIHPEKIS